MIGGGGALDEALLENSLYVEDSPLANFSLARKVNGIFHVTTMLWKGKERAPVLKSAKTHVLANYSIGILWIRIMYHQVPFPRNLPLPTTWRILFPPSSH
jgi:hypothetical protein